MEEDVVCIILVNYNGWQDTIECLESLLKLNYANYNIVIVDNASKDNSIDNIQCWAAGKLDYNFNSNIISKKYAYPPAIKPLNITIVNEGDRLLPGSNIEKIVLLKSKTNKGFAGGSNLATHFSLLALKPKFIWYLNNDTVVDKNSLSELIKTYDEQNSASKKIGIVGSKLMYYHNPEVLQAIGALYNPWTGAVRHVGGQEVDRGQYDAIENIQLDYVVGASMLISCNFIEDVGPMCNDYFLYFEELDWINRGKRKEYTFSYAPKSIIYHKEGATTGGNSKDKVVSFLSDYYNKRNILKITKKFYPIYLPSIYATMFIVILNRLRKRQFKRIPWLLRLLFTTKLDLK